MFRVSTLWGERLYGLQADQGCRDREAVLRVVAMAVPPAACHQSQVAHYTADVLP